MQCPNCGVGNELDAKFCKNCSQKTHLALNSVWRMVLNFFATLIDYDSKFFSSVRGLFFPGFLTTQYLAKKRVGYLTPIRLFVFLMVALFFVMSVRGVDDFFVNTDSEDNGVKLLVNNDAKHQKQKYDDNFYTLLERSYQTLRLSSLLGRLELELQKNQDALEKARKKLQKNLTKSENKAKINQKIAENRLKIEKNQQSLHYFNQLRTSIDIKEGKPISMRIFQNTYQISIFDLSNLSATQLIEKYKVDNWMEQLFFKQMYKFNRDASAFAKFVFQNLTWVIFLELLLLAMFFKLFYIGSKKKYVEHFILLLHVHSWLFFIGIVLLLVPYSPSPWFIGFLLIFVGLYLFLSMKKVYQQSVFVTLVKFFVLSLLAFMLLMISFVLVLLVSTLIF